MLRENKPASSDVTNGEDKKTNLEKEVSTFCKEIKTNLGNLHIQAKHAAEAAQRVVGVAPGVLGYVQSIASILPSEIILKKGISQQAQLVEEGLDRYPTIGMSLQTYADQVGGLKSAWEGMQENLNAILLRLVNTSNNGDRKKDRVGAKALLGETQTCIENISPGITKEEAKRILLDFINWRDTINSLLEKNGQVIEDHDLVERIREMNGTTEYTPPYFKINSILFDQNSVFAGLLGVEGYTAEIKNRIEAMMKIIDLGEVG